MSADEIDAMNAMLRTRASIAFMVCLLAGCAEAPARYAAHQPSENARTVGYSATAAQAAARWFARTDSSCAGRASLAVFAPASSQAGDGTIQDRADAGPEGQDAHRGPLPGFWETVGRDLRAAPGDLWHDTKRVYGRGPNLLILGLSYGGSLALREGGVDGSIEGTIGDGRIFSGDVADGLGLLGNPALHFGVAGLWYLVGQQRQDERTYEIGRTLFSALAINGLTTLVGQAATADHSPNGEWGTFPSGHTSSTFVVASVMHEAYGPWLGAPLYALGAAVAAERLDDGEHYLSDVVMGAVLGLVIGHSVASEHEIELFGGEIVPYADPVTGASGIAWHVSF